MLTRMGLWVRALACGAAASVVACAALAGLEDPDPIDVGDGGSAQGDATSTPLPDVTQPTPSPDGATATDASQGDAPADAPKGDGCALGQGSDPCTKAGDCCSTKCGEKRECVSSCKSSGDTCDPTSTSSCCVGLWCSGGSFQCVPCIPSNQPAATAGVPLAHSCCSRTLKPLSSDCQ